MSNLRRVIEPSRPPRAPATILVSEQPGYALHLPADSVDAWEFEAVVVGDGDKDAVTAARLERLDAALGSWRGEPYGAHSAESWAQPEVARLSDLRRSAIEQWAPLAVDHGRAAQAVQVLSAECDDQPAREEFFRLLALAQYRLGRQADALSTLRRLRSYLADELGVDPAPAIQQLERDILQQSPALDAAVSSPVPTPRRSTPIERAPSDHREPAGREEELTSLLGHAEGVIASGLRVVWVSAEAGGGKSTLAQSFAGRLRSSGWTTAIGHCPEVDGAPAAWAWREMLQQLESDERASGTGPDSTFDIARRVAESCGASPDSPGAALVLDDAHRADGATLQVLRQLATWMARAPVLLMVTYRASESGVDLLATTASLAAVTAEHMDLKGLSDNGIRELAISVGLDTDDASLLDLLRERTDGNPLFVRELAKLVASRGSSHAVETVPSGVKNVLLQRISRLPAEVATVLRLASLFGRTAPIDGVLALWGRSADQAGAEDAVLDAVDTATTAGLLTADAEQIRFVHVLVRDAVYDSVPALRKRRLHWQIVRYLEQTGGVDSDELAHHAALGATSDTVDHAIELVTLAALARFHTDFKADSADLWSSAVRLHELAGHARPDAAAGGRSAFVVALTHLVTALAFRGDDTDEARSRRRQALTVAQDLGDDELIMAALTSWRAPVIWTTRRQRVADTELIVAMTDALARATGEDRVHLLVSAVFELEGIDDRQAIELAEQAVVAATHVGSPEALCAAWNARVYTALGPDLSRALPEYTQQFARVASDSGILAYQAAAHFFSFLARAAETDLPGAVAEVQQGLRSASSGRAGELVVVLSAFSAVLEVLRGDIDRAEREYRDLTERLRTAGAVNSAEIGLVGDMVVGWFRGSLAHLVEPLAVVGEVAPQMISWVYVVALLDAGQPEQARRVASTAPPISRDFYWTAMEVFHARALVRLEMTEAAAELYAELREWSGTVAGLNSGSVAFGPMDVVLAELADLLGDRAAAADHRRTAEQVQAAVRAGLTDLGRR
ncbi:BTAD domain-containing putative transcriptional regulator [Gordonia sp. 'Campus']|uniref:BTAD domain-containing putative transcriptional regulator n=1 Tax=Gordonia sp. 'Campus' TaxID=2915824 RepID=UPI001EE4B7D1|nr:BTAD domain-containing putative transcriptional regulator [Gordonia sp. 'Campus']